MSNPNSSQRGGRPSDSRNNTGGNQSVGPKSFRCDIGGEWKPLEGFSKKFQKMALKPRFNPAKSGMICRIHSGEPALEAKCNGPCGRVLPLNSFSKSTRSKGAILCIQCQNWISTQHAENGSAPLAAPFHERDINEQQLDIKLPMMPEAYADYTGLGDYDDDDDELLAPVTGMAATSFRYDSSEMPSSQNNAASITAPSVSTTPREFVSRRAPPHLLSNQAHSDTASMGSDVSSEETAEWVPPHLRCARPPSPEVPNTSVPASITHDSTIAGTSTQDISKTRERWASCVKASGNAKNLMVFSESGSSKPSGLMTPQQNRSADQATVLSSNEYYKAKEVRKKADPVAQPAQTSGVPSHLRGPSSSTGRQTARSDKWGKRSDSRLAQSDVHSISTATTLRQERANQPFYNAWDNTGALHTRPMPPPSTSDGGDSLFRTLPAQELPTPLVGGFARGFSRETAQNRQSDADDLQNGFSKMDISEQKIIYNFDCEHSDDEDVM